MLSIRRIALVVSVFTIFSVGAYLVLLPQPAPQAEYPIERTIKYSLTVKNPTNQPLQNTAFWLHAPLKQGVYQVLDALTSSHSYQVEADRSGNQRLKYNVDLLPPYGTKIYEVTAKLKLSAEPNTIADLDD
ncbi:MAG: hypothetical protein AB2810_10775 [Candidatus Thiodiazotropha endolucinida]